MTIRIAAGSSAFGESLLFSENLKEIYRNPKKLKPLTYHSITNGDFCFFRNGLQYNHKGEKDDADENTGH